MFILKCETEISCSHHLPNHPGNCKNLHGHNYTILVTIKAKNVNKDGLVADFGDIKKVIRTLDHRNLNEVLHNPTAENMAYYISVELTSALELGEEVEELKVRVTESKGCSVEYIA